jgi:hypothetical protein
MIEVNSRVTISLIVESEYIMTPKEMAEAVEYALKDHWAYRQPKTITAEDQHGNFHIIAR